MREKYRIEEREQDLAVLVDFSILTTNYSLAAGERHPISADSSANLEENTELAAKDLRRKTSSRQRTDEESEMLSDVDEILTVTMTHFNKFQSEEHVPWRCLEDFLDNSTCPQVLSTATAAGDLCQPVKLECWTTPGSRSNCSDFAARPVRRR